MVRSLCLALLFLVVHSRTVRFFDCEPVPSSSIHIDRRHRLAVYFIRWFVYDRSIIVCVSRIQLGSVPRVEYTSVQAFGTALFIRSHLHSTNSTHVNQFWNTQLFGIFLLWILDTVSISVCHQSPHVQINSEFYTAVTNFPFFFWLL